MIAVAHRGFSGRYPENTMISFTKALEYKPDMIETDVQLSSDGEVVIFHDETLERTTGEKGFVKDKTLTELKKLNAANFYPDIEPQQIPTLDEYLVFAKENGVRTFLELKNGFIPYEGMEKKVLDLIDKHDMRDDILIYSANHFSTFAFRAMAPDIEISFPFDNWIIGYGEYCERFSVPSCIPYYQSINETTADEIHRHGVSFCTWTVDEPDDMRRMISLGADGIMTNRIDILREIYPKE